MGQDFQIFVKLKKEFLLILFYLKTHVFHQRLEMVITGLDKIAFLLPGSGKTCGA